MSNKNKNDPLVTVIIPCYNSGKTLAEAIESVLSQSYSNIECLVIDDGSDDPLTLKELDGARARGVSVIKTINCGLSAARNVGIKNASGTFVLPLDADDWLEETSVAVMLLKFSDTRTRDPSVNVAFVFGNMILHEARTGTKECFANPFELLFFNTLSYCLMWDRSVLFDLGFYDQAMKLGYEDWELAIRALSRGYTARKVDRKVLNYRVQSGGMLLSRSRPKHETIFNGICLKHQGVYFGRIKVGLRRVLANDSRCNLFLLLVAYGLYRIPGGAQALCWVIRKRFAIA
jgi:glycosyltransferase involved in cell wall biosynthesis